METAKEVFLIVITAAIMPAIMLLNIIVIDEIKRRFKQ